MNQPFQAAVFPDPCGAIADVNDLLGAVQAATACLLMEDDGDFAAALAGAEVTRTIENSGWDGLPVHWYYDPDAWLEHYIARMLERGWHRDTYVEECHRGFFFRYAQGTPPRKCGIADEHIGGLAAVPALVAAREGTPREELRRIVKQHVGLTHSHAGVIKAADTLVRLLWAIAEGAGVRDAIRAEAGDWLSSTKAEAWRDQADAKVIGERFSPACYIAEAMPAALYLAWKHHDDFAAGITSNAMVGGIVGGNQSAGRLTAGCTRPPGG
ncbi:MAG: ADP-ribosylglycohydrolase family protein [Akkermansiaceae bacterium]|nr:ADP-ribosylglycohydrolase family protein [Akkermansiaceae bacterium]